MTERTQGSRCLEKKKHHFTHTSGLTLVSKKGFLCRISKGKYELVSLDLQSGNRKKVLTGSCGDRQSKPAVSLENCTKFFSMNQNTVSGGQKCFIFCLE